MIATLRESKTRLSELVNLASSGEEILITVHGQAKARIPLYRSPRSDTEEWLRQLSTLRLSLGQPTILVKKSTRRAVKFLGGEAQQPIFILLLVLLYAK